MNGWEQHQAALAAESQRLRDEVYEAEQAAEAAEPTLTWEQQEQDRMIAHVAQRNLRFGGALHRPGLE